MPSIGRIVKKGVVTCGLAVVGFGASSGVAMADCPAERIAENGPLSKVYAQTGDTNDYFLAPGGSFDALGAPWASALNGSFFSWLLASGASTISGGEMAVAPIAPNADLSARPRPGSLSLKPGQWAVSEPVCLDETRPHFRFSANHDEDGIQRSTLLKNFTRRVPISTMSSIQSKLRVGIDSSMVARRTASTDAVRAALLGTDVNPVGSAVREAAAPTTDTMQVWVVSTTPGEKDMVETEAIELNQQDFGYWGVSGFADLAPSVRTGNAGWANAVLVFYAPSGNWRIDSVFVDPYRTR